MRKASKTCFYILALILFSAQSILAQGSKQNAKALITSFLRDVYQTNDDALTIANKYIGLSSMPNEYTSEKRLAIASDHIQLLRKGESLASGTENPISKLDLSDLQVVNYKDVKSSELPSFNLDDEQTSNVYALLKGVTPIKYFYILNNKILSFDYILKGSDGPAYFFSY